MDLFQERILCNVCNIQMLPQTLSKEGFPIRALTCETCGKVHYHPGDIKDYEHFQTMKNRQFQVKLRMVGNSFCVSIPRELIAFNRLENDIDKLVNLMLEAPNKIIIDFTTKVYKNPLTTKEEI